MKIATCPWSQCLALSQTICVYLCSSVVPRFFLCSLLRRRRERAGAFEGIDFRLVVAEDALQHFLGVLAEGGAALDDRGRGGELDRHADVEPLAAIRMVKL